MARDADADDRTAGPTRPGEGKRIELVTETANATRQLIIGWALFAALAIGSPALADAAYGRGPIENALGRFVLAVVACLTAGNILASLLERAPRAEDPADLEDDGPDDGPAAAGDATGDRIGPGA